MSTSAVRLASLALRDFRNFERLDLGVPAEGLALVGENGHGKTNLLEAIYYLQVLRSVRGARDVELVRFGAGGFHIDGTLADGHRVSVGFERATRRKRVKVDDAPVERLSDGIGALLAVMFAPADVELVSAAPVVRRRYLDIQLALASRTYLAALQTYRGALLRRNAALRTAARTSGSEARIAVWEAPLAQAGGVLWRARTEWAARVAARFSALCTRIGEPAHVALRYASALEAGDDPAAAIARALEAKRAMDLRRGLTHAGPHRDDLAITIDGRDLRAFGSAGQQRCAAIALRIVEWESLRDARGVAPLLLLDDPFAELDDRRSTRIIDILSGAGLGQTVLTVPRARDVPEAFTRLERRRVVAGTVQPWEAS